MDERMHFASQVMWHSVCLLVRCKVCIQRKLLKMFYTFTKKDTLLVAVFLCQQFFTLRNKFKNFTPFLFYFLSKIHI